jgi:hypothetical protein
MGANPELGFSTFLDSGSAASRRPGMTAESFSALGQISGGVVYALSLSSVIGRSRTRLPVA